MRTRHWIAVLLLLVLTVAAACAQAPSTVLIVDGKRVELTHPPIIATGDILVWVGDLVRLGWVSIQEQGNGKLVIKRQAVTLTFRRGERVAGINNLFIETTAPAVLVSGRFMVPLGFVCRSLGFNYKLQKALVIEANTASSTGSGTSAPGKNAIEGKVLYNDHPMAGVKVRVVTERGVFVPSVTSITDEAGAYKLSGLPDGKFCPYVYIADNPEFFNRIAETVSVEGGATATVEPIHLGRMLKPQSPKPGQELSATGHTVQLAWTECPEAARYRVIIIDESLGKAILTRETEKSSLEAPVEMLTDGHSYRWTVRAESASGKFLGASAMSGAAPWTFIFHEKIKVQKACEPVHKILVACAGKK